MVIVAPSARQAILHNKSGGDQKNLVTQYDSVTTQSLAELVGEQIRGNWILRVMDLAWRDVGTLKEWSIEIGYVI
ncbi:MAG: proprotein convertase P-domain-containing protein [Candidatus Scalindua sp.]|nr:proprotein convertase P-domain-containing protein [Candidatus Scalindua sp.]